MVYASDIETGFFVLQQSVSSSHHRKDDNGTSRDNSFVYLEYAFVGVAVVVGGVIVGYVAFRYIKTRERRAGGRYACRHLINHDYY